MKRIYSFVGLGTFSALSFGQVSIPQQPNIVIIVADDLGWTGFPQKVYALPKVIVRLPRLLQAVIPC